MYSLNLRYVPVRVRQLVEANIPVQVQGLHPDLIQLRQEVVAAVQVSAHLLLPEARALIPLLPEVAAVVVAHSAVEVAVAAVQVAAVAAVVQVDADNERDNIIIV